MIANRMKPVLFAAALACSLAAVATARDVSPDFNSSDKGYRGHHFGHGHHGHRGHLKRISGETLGGAARIVSSRRDAGSQSPSQSPSIHTLGSFATVSGSSIIYSGGYREIYLGQYASEPQRPSLSYLAPKAKIITVTEELADGNFKPVDGCSYEMGVCVIRGWK